MTDGNYLYSAISVRLVGNNALIYLLRILTSLELFLNHEYYSRHPLLTDVCNNGKKVLEEKLAFYESVFELARGLRDSQTSINNKDLSLLQKKETQTCKDNIWSSFLCVLAFSSVTCRPIYLFCMLLVGFKSIKKCLIKKIIQGKDLTVANALFCYGHVSLKNKLSFTD